MGNNQKQIAALPLPATHKWKGKCGALSQGAHWQLANSSLPIDVKQK